MDYKQIELDRETRFKDAVLESAGTKAEKLVADARKKREKELRVAQLSCRKADRSLIEEEYARQTEQSYSATRQKARQELLQYRSGLVDEVFEEVLANIRVFVQGGQYAAWMEKQLCKLAGQLPQASGLVLWLASRDMPLAQQLVGVFKDATAREDKDISLGGFKLKAGNRLYDETLDARLQAERQAFVDTSDLTV